ncbi:M48 family metallopeptidase [Parasphingorhabdus sp.]
MFKFLVLLILACSGLLSSAASAQSAVGYDPAVGLKNLQKLDQRLHEIGYRLVSANSKYCVNQRSNSGLLLHDITQYGDAQLARTAFGFTTPIAVNAVAAGSIGGRAGIRAGDNLAKINGQLVENIPVDPVVAKNERPEYQRVASAYLLLAEALSEGRAKLSVSRNGVAHSVELTPELTCASRFQIKVDDDRNASANGKIVSISSALAEYFADDDEFAAVAAHELAHNLLNHRDRLNRQKVNRGFFGQFGKSARRIKDTEIEADRLSVWLMANAGYDPEAAIRFWTRYGKEHGKGIFSASTHYRWKKRVKLFEEEIARMAKTESQEGKRVPPLLLTDQRASN